MVELRQPNDQCPCLYTLLDSPWQLARNLAISVVATISQNMISMICHLRYPVELESLCRMYQTILV